MAHWFIIDICSLVGNPVKLSPTEAADDFDKGNTCVLLRGLASPAEARASTLCGSSPSRPTRPGSTTSLRLHIYALSSINLKKTILCIDPSLNFSLIESHSYCPVGRGKRMAGLLQKADIGI